MTEAELLSEADVLRAIIRQLEDENRALRDELAMCPEAQAEMAAWRPDDTSDLHYLDAPQGDSWGIGGAVLFGCAVGASVYAVVWSLVF